ncbi:MAG: PAS domain S-box protein, partial [Desulfitobacterium hafniense]|nr:PAS domain S-box protein [Desulfitobacterium hafniense]
MFSKWQRLPDNVQIALITAIGLFIIVSLLALGHYSLSVPITLLTIFTIFFHKILAKERLMHQGHVRVMRVLLEQNKTTSQLIDYSREAFIILDRCGLILETSLKVCQLLGLSESCLTGHHVSTTIGIPLKHLSSFEENKGELKYTSQQGQELHLEFHIRPLMDTLKPSGFMLILTDITEEKQRFEAYLQAAKFTVVGQVA